MIAKNDLLERLQNILSQQLDLAPLYRQLATWQPAEAAQAEQQREFAKTCQALERDSLRQVDCLKNLCSSIASADRNDY